MPLTHICIIMLKGVELGEKAVLQTVLVIDHGTAIAVLDSIRMDFVDGVASSSSSKHKSSNHSSTSIGSLSKSIWTIMVEGAVEYCRIIYDLLPEDYMVMGGFCIRK